jgi:hypothetical protein
VALVHLALNDRGALVRLCWETTISTFPFLVLRTH